MGNKGKKPATQSQKFETNQKTEAISVCKDVPPKAELESSSKPDKIVLKCGHPYSLSEHIDFELRSGVCDKGWYYNLESDLHKDHIIHRHNPNKKAVLIHKEYTSTLQQWLKDNNDNWCPKYKKWNVNRPKDEARQIIQGILCAINELHSNSSFHGFLYHPENFAFHTDVSVNGGDRQEIKRIFLIHENMKLNEHYGVSSKDKIQQGKKNDIKAMTDLIFTRILGNKSSEHYSPDLQKLHEDLLKLRSPSKLKDLVNHPSLWHWKSRFSYIELARMKYMHADDTTKKSMDILFSQIKLLNWRNKIPSITSLTRVFNNSYGPEPSELLRFLRNVRVHFGDPINTHTTGTKPYVQSKVDYLDEQFIEQKTTEVSELFLVDLYYKMCEFGIEI